MRIRAGRSPSTNIALARLVSSSNKTIAAYCVKGSVTRLEISRLWRQTRCRFSLLRNALVAQQNNQCRLVSEAKKE